MSYFLLWSIPCYYTTRFVPTAQFIQQTEGRREHCQLQEKRQACLQLRALKRSDDSEENQDACLVLHCRPSRENAWVPTDPSTYGMTVLRSRMLLQPVLVTLGNLSIKWTLKFLEIASCFVIRAEVHRPSWLHNKNLKMYSKCSLDAKKMYQTPQLPPDLRAPVPTEQLSSDTKFKYAQRSRCKDF